MHREGEDFFGKLLRDREVPPAVAEIPVGGLEVNGKGIVDAG